MNEVSFRSRILLCAVAIFLPAIASAEDLGHEETGNNEIAELLEQAGATR